MSWRPSDKIGVALFNFDAADPTQLSLQVGDLLYLLEEGPGWYRGHLYQSPQQRGIFPAAFVHLEEKKTVTTSGGPRVVPVEDEVTLEAKECLRQWRHTLFKLYVNGPREKYRQLLHFMDEVFLWRKNILHSSATLDVLVDLKTKLTGLIDRTNAELRCPCTPRNDMGQVLDCEKTNMQELFKVHQERKAEIDQQVLQTGSLQRKSKTPASHFHHLYMQVIYVDHQFPEAVQVFFFLYDPQGRGQLSERFMLPPRNQKLPALFTDLGSKELSSSSMYFVCQIVRKGKMLLDDKKNISHHNYRRPYAIGVVDITGVLQDRAESAVLQDSDASRTLNMPLYICSTNHDHDFATFHSNIIRKTGAKGGQKPGCAISLSLRAFHGELAQLHTEFPLLHSVELVRKLGFPDVILPGAVRNDIYVTLEYGQYEKGAKRAERNVEVSVEVVDNKGKIISDSISLAAGAPPTSEYESFIFYHNNTPKWSETFKLSIPFEKLATSHLRIAFRHVAKNESKNKAEKTFSFTFLKIMKDDGSIIHDGIHELYVYKAESKHWYDPKVYLHNASCTEDVVSQRSSKAFTALVPRTSAVDLSSAPVQISRSFKESVHLSTLTCSTKLTQKIELLMLLKWRAKQRDLGVVLTNLTFIPAEEVVKFLQDTLDCLFDILNSDPALYGEKVFDVLVSIFGQMQEDRYSHFKTVLDIYIEKHFSAILAYRSLVQSLTKSVTEYSHVPEQHVRLIKVIKSVQYLFKFMVQSYALNVKQKRHDDPAFSEAVRKVLGSFCLVMTYQENSIKGIHVIQSTMLLNLSSALPELVQVLPEAQLASQLAHFLNSMRNTHSSLAEDKLTFMAQVLSGPAQLLGSHDARDALFPTFVSHLISHMDHVMPRTHFKPDEQTSRDCLSCVGRVLSILADPQLCGAGGGALEGDVEHVIPLMEPLLKLCKKLPTKNPLYVLNLVNLVTLLDLMRDRHYALLFAAHSSSFEGPLKDFVLELMRVVGKVVSEPVFAETWSTMHLVQGRAFSAALRSTSKALIEGFLGQHFNPQIWDSYFELCTVFLKQPCLQLENYSELHRRQYLEQFRDIRLEFGQHVVVMWHRLAEKKEHFIPDLIGSFLEISLLKQQELRRCCLPVVFDMLKCEIATSANIKRVEKEVFDKMDDLVYKGQGDEEYRELFQEILQGLVQHDSKLSASGTVFVDSVCRLIGLLLDYRNVSVDDKNRRMGCMFNLLNFYKGIDKEELYIRYIYKLAELHENDHCHTEAGFTLLLHAKGLEWSPEPHLEAVGRYPAQPAHLRKEQLYMDAIALFDQGKCWERGVALCKELATVYETQVFDYQKLSSILQKEAEFFQKIIRDLRVEPEYFMVGYYGRGFPLFIRNKVFVHRGLPYERLSSFIKRLTEEFSTAAILRSPPDSEQKNSSGMFLQVRSVQPIAEQQELFSGKRVPDKIAEYYNTNEVARFRYDRPFHKGQKNKDCEFATLWIERMTFTTSESFPGVISWFEVSKTETVELNPLDIAIETVSLKNKELQVLIGKYSLDKTLNINPLSMLLNGIIDAAVMGGVKNYDEIFFNDKYKQEYPAHAEGVASLRTLIEEQTHVLERGLAVHAERISPSLQGLHDKLELCFKEFQSIVFPDLKKQSLRAVKRSQTIARPLPLTPFQQQQQQKDGSPPTPSHMQTLPNRQIQRRATGVPGRSIRTYEDTSPKHGRRPSGNVVASPSRPSPPSPYASRRGSFGDRVSPQRQTSTSSNRLSGLSEKDDDDHMTYERLEDFLVTPELAGSATKTSPPNYPTPRLNTAPPPQSNVPAPQTSIAAPQANTSAPLTNASSSQKKISTPQPNFPAPKPPGSHDNNSDEDDEGYEKVHIGTKRGAAILRQFDNEVERAALPLIRSTTGASKPPKEKPREKERSPSAPDMREGGGGGGGGSKEGSPQRWVETKAGLKQIPPEPSSPPPSPPLVDTAAHHGKPVKPTSPLAQHRLTSEKQPELPPKQRRMSRGTPVEKSNASPPIAAKHPTPVPEHGDEIYSFDRLTPPPPAVRSKPEAPPPTHAPVQDEIYSFDRLTPPPPPVKATLSDEIYSFDSLDPVVAAVTNARSSRITQDEIYSFDRLSPPPPADSSVYEPVNYDPTTALDRVVQGSSATAPPKVPAKIKPVVHQSKAPSKPKAPPQAKPPPHKKASLPSKPPPVRPTPSPDPDEVYFDHLPSRLPPKQQQQQQQQQQGNTEHRPTDDEIYFDHLVTGPPILPSKPPGHTKNASPPRGTGGNPPPIPSKRKTISRPPSESSRQASDSEDRQRPVPRPRINTLERKAAPLPVDEDEFLGDYFVVSNPLEGGGAVQAPAVPPKIPAPSLPPRPTRPGTSGEGGRPPPVPVKSWGSKK